MESLLTSSQVLRDEEYIYVVLPFCNGGELYNAVSPPNTGLVPAASTGLNEDVARPIIRGLLAGMAFLHGHQICHRYCCSQYHLALRVILVVESMRRK